ncbi:putative atg c terminal domain-containing protein [Phaeoacremonium minimum UCRPA7]|uniref:Autophagy-related protein 2 n=1 Tax=Phaeoacremonium minimum (strain UCR-PA7) TaxID=1286976 RepID=R8BUE7_PHAM7|nr:putative atg c terminal domain-containing protein [Phaeoacremonium minimum UCRPA7]EOO02905.1 putative atg c terminal domain-containing protein [Phaeoacremonium minimum UCRPA7]
MFFKSFRNSAMVRRLVLYGLSKLDLFEEHALDLENFELAWGRNTVIEFKDVGMKVQKLAKVLNLPASFTIEKAKVLILRVTIPVDFYTSAITAEVDGVEVRLKVSSQEGPKSEAKKGKQHSSEDTEIIPNAGDLAQSFLQTQPSRDRKELEDALAAETQDLGASIAMSEDGSDDGLAYGTGQELSLPAFLTDFLYGIADRFQLRIRDVTFQLDIEVPVEPNSTNGDLVTFQLAVESIDVEGVTLQEQAEDGTPRIIPKEGKRNVSLNKIRAFLISEANVFTSLARSPSVPSSSTSHSPVLSERQPPSREPSFMAQSMYGGSMADSDDLSQSSYPLQDSEDAFNIPYEMDETNLENEDEQPLSSFSTPRASVYQDFAGHYEGPHAQSAVIGDEEPLWQSMEREAQSEPALPYRDREPQDSPLRPDQLQSSRSSTSSSGGSGPAPAEDLTLSHVYSHEEAEISLEPLEIRFEASIGFLLSIVVSKLLESLKPQSTTGEKEKETATSNISTSTMPELKVSAKQISILFLEKLAGVADTPERIFSSGNINFGPDVLLRTVIDNLSASVTQSGGVKDTSVDIEKFRFGYADSDILSFDRRIQMRASVRDAFPTAGADLSFKVSQSEATTRCNVTTLPLRVHVDLQRLDETFSWFGGLSSFLQMGSSITSNAPQKPKSPVQPAKPRGVRFDAPINPEDRSATSENKIDLRVGGFQLELAGRDCGVSLHTSAVKLVSREEGVGIGISKINLSGPYRRNYRGDAPINVEVTDTRLEYLMTPKDKDLDRLLALITPSKGKFDENDDEIMVDTLLRQRRKGAVLRIKFDNVSGRLIKLQQLDCLPGLAEEVARLGTVAKYLPEDDRPGLLTLGLVRTFNLSVDIGGRFGVVNAFSSEFELAQITVPSLIAFGVQSISVNRNKIEELVSTSNYSSTGLLNQTPVLMVRMIGDEIEPVIKVKMSNLNVEYRVPTVMDILGLAEDATPQDFEASLAASVANLGEQAHTALTGKQSQVTKELSKAKTSSGKPTSVDLGFRDCLIGLNPLGQTSKLLLVLTDARLDVTLPKDENVNAVGHLKKASILLIDDVSLAESKQESDLPRHRTSDAQRPADLISSLTSKGYVNICQISSARAVVQVVSNDHGDKHIDVELRDDLLVLETCADSTQTLISLANALKPPTPPSKEVKYKTEVMPVQDLLASITADAFGKAEGDYDFDNDFAIAQELGGDEDSFEIEDDSPANLSVDSQFYQEEPAVAENLFDATSSSIISQQTTTQDTNDGVLLTNFNSSAGIEDDGSDLDIQENYFGTGSVLEGTAHRWNSAKNAYDSSNDKKIRKSPLKVCVRDMHIIWHLFDGYDWQQTRDVITKTVQEVEIKAHERRVRGDRRQSFEQEFEEEETVIGDFLFNSIYIGIPANHDPRELTQAINQQLDRRSDTESIATTAVTATPSRAGGGFRSRAKKLRLNRSRQHKITFELQGVNVDLVTFPPESGETEASIDVRVRNFEILDNVPTSTWRKFATYDQDAGEREMGTSMLHLEILNTRPVRELAASDIVLRVTVLPLRLHVDQDALDFITRFFEFKDDSTPAHTSPSDVPFIQRAEVNSIPVQLDFKPKRVDYAGLRSGHTTEFMNFLILDGSRMVLRHTIIYGVSGFDRLGKTLNDIWMPDVKRTQLPGVLAGLAPVRSLVNVGSGFRDLVEIPIREYKRDGRIVRSIGRGAAAFAKTTGTEIVKLGAKVAVGTQYVLQGAEGLLVKNPQGEPTSITSGWEEEDMEPEERKQISLYADQPTGVVQGLRHAYSSLARDLNVARDAIIAVPAEVMESQSAQGAAKAVLKRAPTIIFRPAIGATKAIGQTLMGATNALDPQNIRRMEDKYKSGPGR